MKRLLLALTIAAVLAGLGWLYVLLVAPAYVRGYPDPLLAGIEHLTGRHITAWSDGSVTIERE